MAIKSILSILTVSIAVVQSQYVQTGSRAQNFEAELPTHVRETLITLSHLKDAETGTTTDKIRTVFWLQAFDKDYVSAYDSVTPSQSRYSALDAFLARMASLSASSTSGFAFAKSRNAMAINEVRRFLVSHRAELEAALKRIDAGQKTLQEAVEEHIAYALYAVMLSPDRPEAVLVSAQEFQAYFASNDDCVRDWFRVNGNTKFSSVTHQLKSAVQGYFDCVTKNFGRDYVRNETNKKNLLTYIQGREAQLEALAYQIAAQLNQSGHVGPSQ